MLRRGLRRRRTTPSVSSSACTGPDSGNGALQSKDTLWPSPLLGACQVHPRAEGEVEFERSGFRVDDKVVGYVRSIVVWGRNMAVELCHSPLDVLEIAAAAPLNDAP